MNLEGDKLCECVRAEQAIARDERIRISQEKKEARIAAIEDDERIAAKEERARIATTEEAEKIRQHEKDVYAPCDRSRVRGREIGVVVLLF